MSTQAPQTPQMGRVRVGDEMGGNPLSWLLARNKRMADQLDQIPAAASTLQKVLRGLDHFCSRYGLHDPRSRSRVQADVIYIASTDSIVIKLSRD